MNNHNKKNIVPVGDRENESSGQRMMEYIPAKTIVTKTKAPYWFGADYNMNIYRGCNHGCIYCDSRSHCYRIDDFGTVRAKQDALRIIRDDLSKKRKRGVIATGAMSDPYNPYEEELHLTKNALELIHAYRFGVSIATKSTLVVRDTDILKDIKYRAPVVVKLTITVADDKLCKIIEPNAPVSSERFEATKTLSGSGIYTGVLMMPILPFIEDTEENIIAIARKAKECGARFIYPAMGMTLRAGNREYYYENLDRHFPEIKEKYIKRYGERYSCTSPKAKKLWGVFSEECKRLGLLYKMSGIINDYKREYIDSVEQLGLFENKQ
ncbi:MAG: radical SAM protein [Chitinispirillales bacterium]|jgi:DNA repair photolyase|nr:radical SAM protein [Chitinispirillales bacterium]